jgi:hypothetical protein
VGAVVLVVLVALRIGVPENPVFWVVFIPAYGLVLTVVRLAWRRREGLSVEERLRMRPSVAGAFAGTVISGPGQASLRRVWRSPLQSLEMVVVTGAAGIVVRPVGDQVDVLEGVRWADIERIEIEDRRSRPLVAVVALTGPVVVLQASGGRESVEEAVRAGVDAAAALSGA